MTRAPDRPPLEVGTVEEAFAALRAAGHRLTAARRLVLEALFAAEGPVSAEHIADGLGGRLSRSDLPTTYRNLEALEALGLVRHFHLGHGPGLYALTSEREREYLACERCGRVTSVDPAELDPVRARIRAAFGYETSFRHFPLLGRCADCAAAGPYDQGRAERPERRRTESDMRTEHDSHEQAHAHDHEHDGETHSHAHTDHRHEHTEHQHEHSHGDLVHSHPHVHERGLEHDHRHDH